MTRELAEKLDVDIVPLHIKHEENTFLDRVDIEPDQLYDLLEGSSVLPHTSQPSPAAFMSVFEKYPDQDIVVLTIAKELSGTFQSANLAKQISERDDIYIADTRQVTLPLMDLVLEACALRDQEKVQRKSFRMLKRCAIRCGSSRWWIRWTICRRAGVCQRQQQLQGIFLRSSL